MNTVKIEQKKATKIVAHRGVSGLETENTIAAFVAAGNRSYFGIETDTHITADGQYVVMHDSQTGRVAEHNLNIGQTTLAELQTVALKDKDGTCGRIDLRIPLLKDYIKLCKKYEKTAVLELKDDFTDAQLDEIYEICKEYGDLDKTVFISFIYTNVERIKHSHPKQQVQFLSERISEELIVRLESDKIDLDVYYPELTEEWVKKCHRSGIEVNCWTVDDLEDAKRLIGYGVDYITSNILE